MHGRVFLDRLRDEDLLAQIRKQRQLAHRALLNHFVERKIAPLEQAAVDQRPFRKDDRLWVVTNGLERQRVAVDDVAAKDIGYRLTAGGFAFISKQRGVSGVESLIEPLAAFLGVVGQNVNAVQRRDGQHGVALIVQLAFGVASLHHPQLAPQDFHQKVTRAAGRFQEARVNPLGFLPHQVEHGVHDGRWRQHLAKIAHALFGFDVLFHFQCFVTSQEYGPFQKYSNTVRLTAGGRQCNNGRICLVAVPGLETLLSAVPVSRLRVHGWSLLDVLFALDASGDSIPFHRDPSQASISVDETREGGAVLL